MYLKISGSNSCVIHININMLLYNIYKINKTMCVKYVMYIE